MLTPSKKSPMKNSSSSSTPVPGSADQGTNLTPSKYNTLTQPLRRLSTKFNEMFSGKKGISINNEENKAEDEILTD